MVRQWPWTAQVQITPELEGPIRVTLMVCAIVVLKLESED